MECKNCHETKHTRLKLVASVVIRYCKWCGFEEQA